MKKKALNASPQTVAALSKLSLLGLAGFLLYIIVLTGNILYTHENLCKPVIMLVTTIIRESSSLLCVVALLFVFRDSIGDAKS